MALCLLRCVPLRLLHKACNRMEHDEVWMENGREGRSARAENGLKPAERLLKHCACPAVLLVVCTNLFFAFRLGVS